MEAELLEIAPNVWIFPRDEDPDKVRPNVGIVAGTSQTILIDGGNSPRHARSILAAIAPLDLPPISYVIYTHHHWDHVFGAQVFGVPAIAHEMCRTLLAQHAAQPWSLSYIHEEIQKNPLRERSLRALSRMIDDWSNFRIVVPGVTFSKSLRLYLGNYTLDMEHVGGQHAPDSIIVRIPEARVMFLGDCYYEPPLHARGSDSGAANVTLESLLNEAIEIYVDGHSTPFRRADALHVVNGSRSPGTE